MRPDFFLINMVTAATFITIALVLFMMTSLVILRHKQIGRSRMYHQALVQEQERTMQAISQEVHDDIGQHLYVARIKVLFLHDALEPAYRDQVSELAEIVEQLLDSARAISHALNSKGLKQRGLLASVEENIRLLHTTRSLRVTLEVEGQPFMLEPDKELIVYRIYQEAISNVIRHSGAGQVCVRINYGQDHLVLSVQDNGKGFRPEIRQQYEGIGLSNMQERAAILKGKLDVSSGSEQGTLVQLSLPVKKRQEEPPGLTDKRLAAI